MGELFRRGARERKPEDIANAHGRGNDQSELRSIRRRAKTDDRLVAAGDIGFLAAGHLEGAQIRFAFPGVNREDAATISRPDGRIATASTWRGVVPTYSRTDVVVKTTG